MLSASFRHNTQRISHVNTPYIATSCIDRAMDTIAERLRDARERAGFPSAKAAAEAFGWTESAYRHHENGTRTFDVDAARRYAAAFRVNPAWLLALDRMSAPDTYSPLATNLVEVVGSVAAGYWVESLEWDQDQRFTIAVGGPSFARGRRFALRVEGYSMDRAYSPGTILDCVSVFDARIELQDDDHVIVERQRVDGMREYTVKRFHVDPEGRHWLIPESTKPEFQAPIEIGSPSADHDGGDSVNVIAVVVGSYQTRQRTRPSQTD